MVIAPLRQSIVSSIGVVRALTSERAASASVSGSLGRILCEDAAQSPTWATLASRAGGYQHQSHRSLVSVDVHGNKVDRALRQLRRKLIDEGVRETWLKQRVFVKPSHVRKKVLEEAERRVRGEGFKEKMRWILRRKARGY